MSLIRLAKTGLFKRLDVPHEEIRQELLLHRAVLDKALIDFFSLRPEIKKDVTDWLHPDNIAFIDCCENAMLEPKDVLATFDAVKGLLRGKNARFNGFTGYSSTEPQNKPSKVDDEG